jgi:predicted nucleotidyltransferase
VTLHNQNRNKYKECGIYQLTCPACKIIYIGQSGITFKVRFYEHLRNFKYGNKKSKFAQRLLENKQPIGSMESVMESVHINNKFHTLLFIYRRKLYNISSYLNFTEYDIDQFVSKYKKIM